MTIHSDWSRVLHAECPAAFLSNKEGKPPPGPHGVGVIDGHLQLMRLHGALPSWDAFVQYLFVRPIMKLFQGGCPTVVLCFDSYDSVPAYKSMTQGKRTQKHEVRVFHREQELPEKIPHDAMVFLMNRHFKLKVIDMLCKRLPQVILLVPGQRLVVDYKRVVAYDAGERVSVVLDAALLPMGESDVKFCRYVSMFPGGALVHAIDGDYLAIALLYYCRHPPTRDNQIFIYRHLATLDKKEPRGKPKKARQRKSEAESKCWVDVPMLFHAIARAMRCAGAGGSDADRVGAAVFLMLSAGTDFSRGLPLVGPKRMWDALPDISRQLVRAVTVQGAPVVDQRIFAQEVVAPLYSAVFKRHAGGVTTLSGVLRALDGSSLSDGTKGKFPTAEQVEVTIRNLVWVVEYWCMHNGCVATPLGGENGYAVGEGGGICFADTA